TVYEATGRMGGRLRSVRVHGTVVDLGAQYLTMRDDAFRRSLQPLIDDGRLVEWARSFPYWEAGEIHAPVGEHASRYVAPAGMDEVARFLADGLDVRLDSPVSALAD